MNSIRSLLRFGVIAAILLPAGSAWAAPKATILIDFTVSHRDRNGEVFHAYEFAYGDWGDGRVVDMPGKGTLVKGTTGKGGMGENKTSVRFNRSSAVDFIYVVGNGNKATTINFSLTDNDGTEFQWTIPLAGKPTGQMLLQRLDLNKPDNTSNAGKTPGLDRKRISSWQVRGDYQDPAVEVVLLKVGTIIEE